MKSFIKKSLVTLLAIYSATSLFAASVVLTWLPSPDTNVIGYKIYAVQGQNTVFVPNLPLAVNNTNATFSVSVTNQLTTTISNLPAGYWTFTAVSFDGNGNYSLN